MRALNCSTEKNKEKNMDIKVLDLTNITDVQSFHEEFAKLLALKDYGKNLDAMHDVLTSIGLFLKITNINHTSAEIVEYLPRLIKVLTDSARENLGFNFELRSDGDYIEEDLMDMSVFD